MTHDELTHILIVDDSPTDQEIVRRLLRKEASGIEASFAEHGAAALEAMKHSLPTMVITDLQMPELDGLGLVTAIRRDYPSVPVVLITGNGSEELAVNALKQGAASYVPKASLHLHLIPTVMQVLAAVRAGRDTQRMQKCWQECRCEFVLPNDHNLIDPLVAQIRQMVDAMKIFDDTVQTQLSMALNEAVTHAMYHGNLELTVEDIESIGYDLFDSEATHIADQRRAESPYKDRSIFVQAVLSSRAARFVVRDEGPGFDHASVPLPAELVSSSLRSGRALTHMRLFSDEIIFNDEGNEVTMIKRT